MSYKWMICLALASHLFVAEPVEAKKKKLFTCGLSLEDSAQGFANAMSSMSNGRTGTTGFTVDVYTPFTWIAQNSSWEAKKYKQMTPEPITAEMTESVLHIHVVGLQPTQTPV